MTTPSRSATERRDGVTVARETVLVAVWSALVTAALHVTYLAIRQAWWGLIPFASRDVIWMAPLGYLALALSLGVVMAVLRLAMPRLVTRRVVTTTLLAFGAFCVLLLIPRVHWVAKLILALGIAVKLAGVIDSNHAAWRRSMRRSALALATSMLLIGALGRLARATAEYRFDREAPAAAAGAPNVLLIILDTVRAASLSLYGYPRETTPEIARFAAEGTVFDRAYSTAPWTLPSHASMLTGRYPPSLRADWHHRLDDAHPVIAEAFRRSGYHTVGVSANLLYATSGTGLARGFDRFDAYPLDPRELLLSTTLAQTTTARQVIDAPGWRDALWYVRHPDLGMLPYPEHVRRWSSDITREFLDWQARSHDRPFFALLNYFDAHKPYEPSPAWRTRFAAKPGPIDLYDASIAQMDRSVGTLLATLRERGVLDNTIVIITSDHGEQFGEHGHFYHGNSVYLPLLHVPLVIRYPRSVPAAVRIDRPVSLRDIAATIIDLARVRDTVHFRGVSLATAWSAGDPRTSPIAGSPAYAHLITPEKDDTLESVIDATHHFISSTKDRDEELFLLADDPREANDLSDTPTGRAWIERFRAANGSWSRIFEAAEERAYTSLADTGSRMDARTTGRRPARAPSSAQ